MTHIKLRYLWKGKWYYIDLQNDNTELKFQEYENRNKTTRFDLCSGSLDKNGKKIYEGDIVKSDSKIFKVGFGEHMVDLEPGTPYHEDHIGFYLKTSYGRFYSLFYDYKKLEVIGNIYENGDLLK